MASGSNYGLPFHDTQGDSPWNPNLNPPTKVRKILPVRTLPTAPKRSKPNQLETLTEDRIQARSNLDKLQVLREQCVGSEEGPPLQESEIEQQARKETFAIDTLKAKIEAMALAVQTANEHVVAAKTLPTPSVFSRNSYGDSIAAMNRLLHDFGQLISGAAQSTVERTKAARVAEVASEHCRDSELKQLQAAAVDDKGTVDRLRRDMESMRKHSEALVSEQISMQQDVLIQKQRVETSESEMASLRQDNLLLKKDVEELRKRADGSLAEHDRARNKAELEMIDARSNVDYYKRQAQRYRGEQNFLEGELVKLERNSKYEADALTASNNQLLAKLKGADKAKQMSDKACDEKEEKILSQDAKLKQGEVRIRKLNETSEIRRQNLEARSATLEELRKSGKDLIEVYKAMDRKLKSGTEAMTGLRARTKRLEELESTWQANDQELRNLRESDRAFVKLDEAWKVKDRELGNLRIKKVDMTEELSGMRVRLSSLSDSYDHLHAAYTEKEKSMKTLEAAHANCIIAREACKKYQDDNGRLTGALEQSGKHQTDLKTSFEAAQSETQGRLASLRVQYKMAMDRLNRRTQDLEAKKECLLDTKEEKKGLETELAKFRVEHTRQWAINMEKDEQLASKAQEITLLGLEVETGKRARADKTKELEFLAVENSALEASLHRRTVEQQTLVALLTASATDRRHFPGTVDGIEGEVMAWICGIKSQGGFEVAVIITHHGHDPIIWRREATYCSFALGMFDINVYLAMEGAESMKLHLDMDMNGMLWLQNDLGCLYR